MSTQVHLRPLSPRLLLLIILSTALSACQVVSVKSQAINVTIADERNSILTQDKLSSASLNVLSMTGRQAQVCTENPDQCVDDLKQLPQIIDEQFLSTASEMYLAKAMQLEKSSDCKVSSSNKNNPDDNKTNSVEQHCLDQQLSLLDKSIRYSYAYLFQSRRQPQERIFDNRQVQIRDFYNQAIAKLVTTYNLRYHPKKVEKSIQIGNSTYRVNLDGFPFLENQQLEQLVSSYNLNFSGLKSMNRRDGFGSEFVSVFPETENDSNRKYIIDPMHFAYKNGINPNIHNARYLATTIVVAPRNAKTVDEILNSPELEIKLFDPYKIDQVKVANKDYPLAANFTAPYGLWLAENNLGLSAYLTLIDRDKHLDMPHLYMLEPYNPNKKIIVLIHGLASSPEAWIGVTNDIMGDPILREKYQVWQIFYSTNMPILESRFQIDALLRQAFGKLNPKDAAAKDVVLIGHSMGGIISRLLVSQNNIADKALQLVSPRERAKLRKQPLIMARLNIQPINNFSRAIFMSSPHRGTEYAELWFTRVARKIIKIPGAFLGAITEGIGNLTDAQSTEYLNAMKEGLIQNGPSDLSYKSKFMIMTKDVMPSNSLKFHSIIGNITNSSDPKVMTDGIVPYKSAHLDNPLSEEIIHGGHSIQETPEAILELRRILRLHLAELGLDPSSTRQSNHK